MNSKFKRLLACLLSLMMVISIFPMSAITAFAAETDEIATVSEGNVAKVGNTEYATIDEAIAAWTNGTTLTLLSDVTLTDVIKLSSTEYHILDLGTYTMTAASKKDAIQIVNNGRTSASWTLDIKADTENPGGITATGKAIVRTTGKSGVKDRPIIRFYNGVFTGSYVVYHSGSNGTNCPQFQFHGGEFNGTISTNRALNQFYGGTFTGSLMMSVDSSAYTLISGGTFKNLSNLYMSALNSGKFTIGSAKGVYDKEVYVDDNGNYVIAAAEPAQGIEAAVAKTPGTNDYLAYSKVATEGVLKYTDATMALKNNNKTSAVVTIYADEIDLSGIDEYKGTIVVPEGNTLKITNAPDDLKVEGDYEIVVPVAQIGETSYNSLSDAIANATAGQTITFLADITEDVTISKAVTIDGNSKTYTGAMTLKADTTIKNVNFDGKDYNGYAVTTRGANYLTIVDCTAKNYGYGFVQLASATALTTVKNVTVSDTNYGIKIDYSGAVVIENADMNCAVAAVLNSNYGEKTITIKDSELSILGTWTRNNTTKTTYVFEGDNTIDSFIIDAAIDTFKLAAGATLTAPNAVTVTTDVEDGTVVYEDGKYYVQTGLAGSGTASDPYQIGSVEDLIMLRDSVNAGETKYNAAGMYFVLTADIDLAGINWVGIGSATADHGFMGNFDGNGYKIKNLTITNPAVDADGYAYAGLFSITEGEAGKENVIKNLIIENVTISTTGDIVAAAIAYPYYTTVENITVCGDINITGGNYTAGALAYTRRCVNASKVTVSGNAGSTITGKATVGGVISDIQMNGGLKANYSNFAASGLTIKGNKSVGGISGIISGQTLNGATVKNVELVCNASSKGIVSGSMGDPATVINASYENVVGSDKLIGTGYSSGAAVEAMVGNTYYATFEQAVNAAFANAYANNGAKQIVYTVDGVKYAELGVWGGIDWTLTADGTLTIAPTKGAPVADKNAPTKRTYKVGEWRETVIYKSNGSASAIGGAPYDMKAVKKLIIEEGVTKIGSFTCQFPNLTGEVVLPSTLTYIGQEAFHKTPITKLTFAAGGTEGLCIANGAFKKINITEVSFPGDREYIHIHHWAFGGCAKLTTAYIPANVTKCWGGEHVDYFDNFNSQTNVSWTYTSSPFTGCTAMQTVIFENEAVRDLFFGSNRNSTAEDPMVAYAGLTAYNTFDEALAAALEEGVTLGLAKNVTVKDTIVIPAGKTLTFNLNGKTITGTDNATGSFGLITNKGELTITGNGKITLTATNNRGWNAYSSVISNTVGGKLIVENGTIEHLGGTDMAYGIDNLTNGKGTYAETIINGGTIKSTYRAIRMFLNGIEAENILTVNGGVIEGTNKSIWVQDPSTKNNTGKITVAAGAVLNGDVYLYATAGSAEWPVEVSIAASAVNGEVLTGNLPNGYILEKKGGNWTVNEYIAKVGNKYYKTLQAAVDAANQYQTVDLLQDAEGAGVVINKKTTINFAGFTYTLTEPVGSTGTKSNGFQILAGNYTVRLLNGTLKVADDAADKFYILVQNYSDLIVQKMTLDGTNLDKYAFTDGDSYTLSNNSGNVQVNVAKIIANNDGDKAFAFDACDMSASGYKLPSVLVYSSSTIEGKIEAAAKVGQRYYATFEQAFADAEEGKTITLFAPVVVKAGETLNLNKKVTISYTSKVAGEDMITNRGTVIVDGATLVYKNTDKTASNVTVSTISCEPGSVLEVKNGVVKNNSANNGALGIYAYAIDMLTNGNMGDVTANISGGQVICTNYMAIRQFNNGTACKNTLNVTGGYIYGAKRAIQIHMDNNAAYLAISGGKVEAGKDGYALCLFPKAATNVAVTGGEFIGAVYSGTNGIISGGTFDAAVYEGYITESYKMVKVDGVYNVIFDETYGSIATIGDKKYSSFAAAWNDAQNGDTIVLQNNIAIDTETFTVADGKKITLDMNGYTITVTDNATKNYELFYIYGEMVVTGKGTIELTSTNNREWNAMSAIFHNRGGVLTIENGTYTNLGGTDMAWVVDNSGNYYGDAVTNINGGILTSTYTAIRNRMEQNTHGASGKAILNVTGGKIDGTTSAIWAQAASVSTVAPATGEINISGGEIGLINTARSEGAVSMTTITGGTVAGFKGESGELKVNGGTITGTITILFADGTEPVKTVVKSKVYYGAVAKIGSTYYATLADAIKKCTGAQAITLLRDIEGEGFVITGKTAIDFNGYTYTVTAPVAGTNVGVQINASGKTVRLINGTLTAAEGSGVEVLVENNSTLTIQRQTLAVTSGTALLVKGGSASINIATINAEGATAIEVLAGKITVYSEGRSSFINGEKLAKKSGSNYIPVA